MKLNEIKKMHQTSDTEQVNQYLSQGYEVIKIISSKVPVSDHGDMAILPMYVLGKK